MTVDILKKAAAVFLAISLLICSLPMTASAEFNDKFNETVDKGSLYITQKVFGDKIKAEMPAGNTFEKRLYDTSRGTLRSGVVSGGATRTAEFTAKATNLVTQKGASAINAFGRWGMDQYKKYALKEPGSYRRTGKMAWKWARHESYKKWYNRYKKLADYSPKISKKLANRLGAAADAGVGLYGFYTMWDEPTLGYKSPCLEFCGNILRGTANAATMLARYVPGPDGKKAKILSAALTVADVAINNPVVIEMINEEIPSMGFLDDWTNIMDQCMKDMYDNIGDWLNYGIWGIEGDENEKLLAEMKKKCKGQTFQGNGVGVYKPNIYLYPTEETDVSVTFSEPWLLTVTDPPYESGWNAGATPDGTLLANGCEYGYLFYESQTFPDLYQTGEGFVIPADERRDAFTRILAAYGLNETEISDFNEFWCEKLEEGCNYAMYPQLNDTVDKAMPITITPKPDATLRLWFAFVKNETPKSEAKPQPLTREGFTAIEWGGMFLDR